MVALECGPVAVERVAVELDDQPFVGPQEVRGEAGDQDVRTRRRQPRRTDQPQHRPLATGPRSVGATGLGEDRPHQGNAGMVRRTLDRREDLPLVRQVAGVALGDRVFELGGVGVGGVVDDGPRRRGDGDA